MKIKNFTLITFMAIEIAILARVPKAVKVLHVTKQISQRELPLFMRQEDWNQLQQQLHVANQQNVMLIRETLRIMMA